MLNRHLDHDHEHYRSLNGALCSGAANGSHANTWPHRDGPKSPG